MFKSANSRRSPSLSSASSVSNETPSFDSSVDGQTCCTRKNSFEESILECNNPLTIIDKETFLKNEDNVKREIVEKTFDNVENPHVEGSNLKVLEYNVKEEEIINDDNKDDALDVRNLYEEVTLKSLENAESETSITLKDEFNKINQVKPSVNFEKPDISSTTQGCDNSLNLDTLNIYFENKDNQSDIESKEPEQLESESFEDSGFKNGVCISVCDANPLHEGVYVASLECFLREFVQSSFNCYSFFLFIWFYYC